MSEMIVGQSSDHEDAMLEIKSLADIGTAIIKISEQFHNHEKRITEVEDTMRVNGVQEMRLTDAVNKRVVGCLGGKSAKAYIDLRIRGKVYSAINRTIKKRFGVPRRAEVPAKEFDSAMKLIENWEMDYELKLLVVDANGAS